MAAHIRWGAPTGSSLSLSLERNSDGAMLDFANATVSGASVDVTSCTFTTGTPATQWQPLVESADLGEYDMDIVPATLPAMFTNGNYTVRIKDAATKFVTPVPLTIIAGDDFAPPSTATVDNSTIAGIVAAIFAQAIEEGVSMLQAMRAIAADAAGAINQPTDGSTTEISGIGTTTPRITATNTPTSRTVTLH